MSSFVHCNKCFKTPSPGDNFFFTSCGHILCEGCKCNGTANQTVPMLDEGKQICSACSRQAGIVPINRNMRPDIMELFKPPAVLLQEYTQKLGKAISFQAYQRERMFKRQQEMYNKAIQRMLGAQKELKKWTEKERSLLEEKKRLATELERQQANVLNLTTLLNSTANRTINNDNMHNNTATSGSNHTMHDSPSLSNGNTPNIHHRHGNHHHLQQQQFLSMTLPPPPLSSRSAIRTRRLEAVVFGSAGHRPTVSSPSASSSISAFHRPRPTPPLMPGRITKGPVLPPSFLPHPHRRRD